MMIITVIYLHKQYVLLKSRVYYVVQETARIYIYIYIVGLSLLVEGDRILSIGFLRPRKLMSLL